MGECLVVIPVRVPLSVLERLQRDAAWVAPFEEDGKGKSTVARVLMMHAYEHIDKGILPWGLEAVKGARGNSSRERSAQSEQSIPKVGGKR